MNLINVKFSMVACAGATPGGTKGRLSTTECTYLPTFIDSIHILFLLYLLPWFGFSTSKPAGFHQII